MLDYAPHTLPVGASAPSDGKNWAAALEAQGVSGHDGLLLGLVAALKDGGSARRPDAAFQPERASGYCAC